MRALTIKQPWAWAIAAGHKRIENRSWPPPRGVIGERIAIHAGCAVDRAGLMWIARMGLAIPDDLDSGAIIATARVVACVTESGDPWFIGPFGWLLEDVRPVPAIATRGQLGLWKCPDL